MSEELSPLDQAVRDLGEIRRTNRRQVGIDEALTEPINPVVLSMLDVLVVPSEVEKTVGWVADRLGFHESRASRLADEAAAAGLVIKQTSISDARKTCLVLTPAGVELSKRVHKVRWEAVVARMEGWSPKEILSFMKLLHRFVEGE